SNHRMMPTQHQRNRPKRPARPQLTRNRLPIMRTQHNTTHRHNLRSLRHEDHPTPGALTTGDQGPLQHPTQNRKAGAQKQALPRGNATGVVPPRKTSPPHRAGLAPATPTVQVLGWQGRRERAGMAPQLPSVRWSARWVGADLTEGQLAPPGPSVQRLGRWAGADLPEVGQAPATPGCPGAGLGGGADLVGLGAPLGPSVRWPAGWGGADLTAAGTGASGCPGDGLVGQDRTWRKAGGSTSSFRVPSGWVGRGRPPRRQCQSLR
ncbi:hypothetical protein LV75_002805, partial [Actinokineospora diospyrosa]|nr:hypothetical protein [Actinokineospora diospyrosa]